MGKKIPLGPGNEHFDKENRRGGEVVNKKGRILGRPFIIFQLIKKN